MAQVRWQPLPDWETVRRQVEDLIRPVIQPALVPSVEVYTTSSALIVTIELPGAEAEAITLEVGERSLRVSGEIRRDRPAHDSGLYRAERQYGRFERQLTLPQRIEDRSTRAIFKNGILTVEAPLVEEARKPRARRLKVEMA